MKILKYSYLSLGLILFLYLNYLSYFVFETDHHILIKLLSSFISLLSLIFIYLMILKPEIIVKRKFASFSIYAKIVLYFGVIIVPLISIYYV